MLARNSFFIGPLIGRDGCRPEGFFSRFVSLFFSFLFQVHARIERVSGRYPPISNSSAIQPPLFEDPRQWLYLLQRMVTLYKVYNIYLFLYLCICTRIRHVYSMYVCMLYVQLFVGLFIPGPPPPSFFVRGERERERNAGWLGLCRSLALCASCGDDG